MATLKNRRIIALLKSIKSNEIPDDSEIIDILDFGTSKSIKILIDILAINKIKLRKGFQHY